MQNFLLGILLGILILSGCSLNTSEKQGMGETGDEMQSSSNPKKAIENEDVVNINGKISNLYKFKNFIINVDNGVKDIIHITMYTVEGDPIFYNLNYDGNQIQYTYNDSQDRFSGSDKEIKKTSCSNIETKNTENGVEYHLSGCSPEVGDTFYFFVSE